MTKWKRLADPYVIRDGSRFRLNDIDPDETSGLGADPKEKARDLLEAGVQKMAELQEKLYAQDRWAVLLIFQAMDAAGKDGTIKHVMSGINPQGCQVFSFKAPSAEELDHDFLWRTTKCLPERGRIGIFNRSYYEEVLIVRVHPEILRKQRLPAEDRDIWRHRFDDIRSFERHLTRNGTLLLKFFLHVSRKEQKKRFLSRLDTPEKYWKFSLTDAEERKYWKQYMNVYEEMIRETATRSAPWIVVPADHKWYTRLIVAAAVVDALEDLKLSFPRVEPARKEDLQRARRLLESE
jgi:PPK2 family polyphosphate:nucleotide phosphotransferase